MRVLRPLIALAAGLFLMACGGAPAAQAPASSPASPAAIAAPAGGTSPAPAAGTTPPPVSITPTPNPGAPTFAQGSVTIQAAGGPVTLAVEIAADDAQREYGLMNRQSLAPDAGMLFIFQPPADAKRTGFWMKDTLIPLSVAFVDPTMAIESVQEMQALDETDIHYAPRDYTYAIEANQGYFTSHGVALGDKVSIHGPILSG